MRKSIAFSILFLFIGGALWSQKTVAGKVVDENGQPLASASVKSRKTNNGTTTSADGTYRLQVAENDEIEVTIVGFAPMRLSVGNRTELNFNLVQVNTELTQIILVGTRSGGRVKTESPVPVDVIDINRAGNSSGRMDLTSALNYAAPSFNYNKQTGADGADHIDLGTLRGMGPDQTLVMINGKRRHQTAFVALFGTRGRGNSGVDMNSFPEAAVERIEILRDGASAQYGSDAMAGVINIILRKDVNKWNFNAGWSGYYDTKFNAYRTRDSKQYYYSHPIDGGTLTFSANHGFNLGKKGGFINITLDFLRQAKTYRQVKDTNVMSNANAMIPNYGRRAFGDGSVTTGGGLLNLELPVGASGKTSFYAFGGYNYKAADAFAYSRNWNNPTNNPFLSTRPDRYPVDANGDLIFVPSIMRTATNGEIYYNPHIQTHIQDISLAAGIKGSTGKDWNWDLSNTIGRNDFHYYGDKTFNASLVGQATPTHFDDGGFNFLQNTLNLDFSRNYNSILEGFNLGLGAEFRYERYSIYKGEESSYTGYPNSFDQAPGSQGFPGFSPTDEVNENRTVVAGYADGELNVTNKWLVDLAIRFENFSDFGFVSTGKIATRYKVAPNFNIRGSVSTGFRAPSLQQKNFSNTLTSFVGGTLVQSRIARNGDAVTRAAGIPDLKEETGLNASLGFTYKPISTLTFTIDGYMVKVKNRIVLSGLFFADDNSLPPAFTSQLQNLGVASAQFFDNAVNTTNTGLDVVIDYTKRWSSSSFKVLLTGNIQKMKINEIHIPVALDDSYQHRKTFFSDREETFLKESAPRAKLSFSLDYGVNKLNFGTHLTYFGRVQSLGFGWTGLQSAENTGGPGDPAISGSFSGIDPYVDIDGYGYDNRVFVEREIFDYSGKLTTDIYASYKICKSTTIYIGADNLFNVHPDYAAVPNARYEAFDNETGGAWEAVQMGFNGRRLFGKVAFTF